jgi:autotransporter-associated beta strand protein
MKNTLLYKCLALFATQSNKKNTTRFNGLLALFLVVMGMGVSWGQTSYTSTSATSAWNAARWNNSSDASPYTSTFPSNNAASFTSGTYNFAGMGAVIFVGNVTVASGVTVNFASTGSTFSTNGNVRTFDIGSGGLFNFNSQAVSTGTLGFIKSGSGTLFISGGSAYTGGFTLNAGTMVVGGVNALGTGGSLSLNGGTLCASSTKDLTAKFSSITIGGDVQFGEITGNIALAAGASNLTFSNNMSLGSSLRTLTLGGSGTIAFGGIISNTGSNGLTFTANSNGTGRFDITGTNTFTGPVNINGNGTGVAEVRFTTDASIGNSTNTITIDGGRFGIVSGGTVTIASTRNIAVGSTTGTSITAPGSTGALTYNGVIADKSGSTGILSKQGSGILSLGGVSTYTGNTAINNGTIQLTTGDNRLPTGTVLSLGQAASTNLGTLNLNGLNQTIAGLNSTTGSASALTNTGSNNTITSTGATTLTVNGSGTYGDATDANSGIIAGAISLVKSGSGTLTLGDVNTYTGITTVSGGTLQLNNVGGTTIPTTSAVTVSGGTLRISSNQTLASLTVTSGTVQVDTGVTLTIAGNVSIPSGANLILNGTITESGSKTLTIASGSNVTIGNASGLATATGTFSGGKTFTAGANYAVSVATTTPLSTTISANNFSTTESITLNSAISVTGTLSFGNVNSKTITTGGNLTLVSTSLATASIADLTNAGVNSGNLINGNVTVERYIPAKRAWRALTAPLKGSGGSIYSQWQNGGNVIAGVGVELWSSTGGNGMGAGPSNSILTYNNAGTTGAWNPVTNTNTKNLFESNINNAFMVFVTGPYATSSTNISAGSAITTLKATGQLITGTQTYENLPSGVHTLIGNPYACPISPLLLLNGNTSFGANLWVWDANTTVNNGVGAYNTYDKTTNKYTNITNSAQLATTPDIQSGQAFFVKASTGTATLSISESYKSTGTSTYSFLRTSSPPELLRVGLYKQVNNEWSGRDGAMTVILADADANQASNKMANGTENIAFTKNGASFASNHHLPLVASDVLNVKVWNTTAGANYKLKINTEEFMATNLEATLEDLFTNARTPLTLDGSSVEYPFTVTTEALSTGDRFRIVFQPSLLGNNIPKSNGFSIVPNPVTGDSFQVNLGSLATGTYSYSICNTLGQEVEKGTIQNAAQNTNYEIKMSNSATGIYIMKIKGNDNSVFTAKIIKK